ncbi:hypothetical protein [Botrimarina mediterranea]|uniref:Uncharacterized protein n=1 Tax=Botrimarina mediterranea TaxID=2528022 RepID=A0A518K379_9BACT|nr:hypothetical protein [Botrimarina mediterranea]QDV72252.1 hypothetical protein Spa11_04250 [Botrimarina mediterranea]QDV76796.1 hypothetical protein K2D_03780 [Planctomycetes bacterium K2D]
MGNAATQSIPQQTSDAARSSHVVNQDETCEALPDLVTYVTTYARQNPDVAAMWCFGVGFVLGWKLKPW